MSKVRVFRPGSWGDPKRTETTPAEVEKVPTTPSSITITTGNGNERISVGDKFPSRAGGRLILRVRWNGQEPGVFYYENGKVYGHHALYFWKDSWMEAFQTGAHWARGGAALAMIQVELCLGIMAGAGGRVAHWALTATDVLHLAAEVDVGALIKGIPKLLEARRQMKATAPRLYDKLFSKFMDQLLENVGSSLAAVATAHFVGRALGRLGRHVPGQLMKTIKDIAGWAGTFIALRLVAAASLAAKDFMALALEMKAQLAKQLNIQISDADAEAIVREMWAKKLDVLKTMQLIQGADSGTAPAKPPAALDPTRRWPHGRNSP